MTDPVPKQVELVALPAAAIDALAIGDLVVANEHAPLTLTPYFVSTGCRRLWGIRSTQLALSPDDVGWITRVVVDRDSGTLVGRAGFHGPPNSAGMVEVGYEIDEPFRRRGYARAALLSLLEWAASDPSVHTVRATISPDNEPSRALVASFGFVENGEQWDDEDGLETIFERPCR